MKYICHWVWQIVYACISSYFSGLTVVFLSENENADGTWPLHKGNDACPYYFEKERDNAGPLLPLQRVRHLSIRQGAGICDQRRRNILETSRRHSKSVGGSHTRCHL